MRLNELVRKQRRSQRNSRQVDIVGYLRAEFHALPESTQGLICSYALTFHFGFLHAELPGFYFDPELNRYFPLPRERGRGNSVQLLNGGASSSKQVLYSLSFFELSLTWTARVSLLSFRFLCMHCMVSDLCQLPAFLNLFCLGVISAGIPDVICHIISTVMNGN